MSILRQIDFGDPRSGIDQRADTFDCFVTNAGNVSFAEPFQDGTTLQSYRQRAEFFHDEIDIRWTDVSRNAFDPSFLFGCDHRRAPDALADVTAKCLFQIWNDAVTNAIAQWREIEIRNIFAEFVPMFVQILVDLRSEEHTSELQ